MAKKLFTKEHDWVQVSKEDSSIVVVGITDYAQDNLGDIVYAELPELGSLLEKGKEIAVLESAKIAYNIYAPVSGTVTEINEKAVSNPQCINRSPLGEGWLLKMKLSDEKELDSLLSEEDYLNFLDAL